MFQKCIGLYPPHKFTPVGFGWHKPWVHNCIGSYPVYFMSSFRLYINIACDAMRGLHSFRKNYLAYNMYVFNLHIEDHILMKKY